MEKITANNKIPFAIIIAGLFIAIAILFSGHPNNDSNVKSNESKNSDIKNLTVQSSIVDQKEAGSVEISAEQDASVSENETEDSIDQEADDQKNESELFKVSKVIDGDTIDVEISGESKMLRLIGINTPETVDPRKPVQCFGLEASNKAKEILAGKNIVLEIDDSSGDRDKYGRFLRYVFLEDGTNFNKLMISEGYAYEYTYDVPYRYQNEFKKAEQEAREAKRGLWAENTCSGSLSGTVNDANTISESKQTENTIPTPVPEPIQTSESDPIPNPISEPIPEPVPEPAPTPEPVPTPELSCYCANNSYNCGDFKTHIEAQNLYSCCMQKVGSDIHRLDADKDGQVCESLP